MTTQLIHRVIRRPWTTRPQTPPPPSRPAWDEVGFLRHCKQALSLLEDHK